MIKLYFIFLLVAFTNIVKAQDAIAILDSVRNTYYQTQEYSCKVIAQGYTTIEDKKGIPLGNGTICKHKEKYFSQFEESETIVFNANDALLIDNEDKSILILSDMITGNKKPALSPVSNLLKEGDTIVYVGKVGNTIQCRLFNKNLTPVLSTDLYINSKTFFLEKLIYELPPDDDETSFDMHHVEIKYTDYKMVVIDKSYFNKEKYVRIIDGKTLPTANYKNYEIITNKS